MTRNAKLTESFVSQTVVGGKYDGQFLTGSITVTNRGEEIANFSTMTLDKLAPMKYNKEAENLTVFELNKLSTN
jgi:hypothetical protein